MKKIIFFVCVICCCFSCQTLDVFEKTVSFPSQQWSSKEVPTFTFDVTDTTSFHNFYLVLRHTEKYPYKNIWLELTVKAPNENINFKKEFTLADNEKWLGTTIDDITDQRIIFNLQPTKLKKGRYTFSLKQIMRDDPLPFILSAGVRVQKIVK